jgi:ribosomal protein S1
MQTQGTVDAMHFATPLHSEVDLATTYAAGKKLKARIIFVDRESKVIGLTLRPSLVDNLVGTAPAIEIGTIFNECKVVKADQGSNVLVCGT